MFPRTAGKCVYVPIDKVTKHSTHTTHSPTEKPEKPYPDWLTENPPGKRMKRCIEITFDGKIEFFKRGKTRYVFEL